MVEMAPNKLQELSYQPTDISHWEISIIIFSSCLMIVVQKPDLFCPKAGSIKINNIQAPLVVKIKNKTHDKNGLKPGHVW